MAIAQYYDYYCYLDFFLKMACSKAIQIRRVYLEWLVKMQRNRY